MTYPSKSKVARREESANRRERERQHLAVVNAKLKPLGIDWKKLMELIVNDMVQIVIPDDGKI